MLGTRVFTKNKSANMQKLALSNRGNGSKHLIELEKVTTFLKKALASKTTLLKQSFNLSILQHLNHRCKQLKHLLPTLKP